MSFLEIRMNEINPVSKDRLTYYLDCPDSTVLYSSL
jgi:hypothetical protein